MANKAAPWVPDILSGFLQMPPGLHHLSEIYPVVLACRAAHGTILPATDESKKGCIRETLQRHSSDCPYHWSPKYTDYFYSREKRSGWWGLRDQFWPQTETNPAKKIWIETPEPGYFRAVRGTLEEMALPKTLEEMKFLAEYALLCSAKDPCVGIRVSLYEKT